MADVNNQSQVGVDRMMAEIRTSQQGVTTPVTSQTAPFGDLPHSAPRRSIRREPPPLDPALVPTEDPLRLRLAEELEYARRLVELLGDTLCNDPMLVTRHAISLQSIDVVGQMLGHLAAVTRSALPEQAVDRIGMSDLKGRLKRRPAL